MGMNTLPACPTMLLSSQQTHFLNHCRSWHLCDCTLLQFCHLTFPCGPACCWLPTCQLHPALGHRGHPAPPSQGHLPVPGGCGLKAQSSAGVEGPSLQGLTFWMALESLFPTTQKLQWTEELPEAANHHRTLSPFTSGGRNLQKGRKNSGPCCILIGEAGGTQGTSESPHNTGEAPGAKTDPAQKRVQIPSTTSI